MGRADVYRFLGYPPNSKSKRLEHKIDAWEKVAVAIAEPKVVHKIGYVWEVRGEETTILSDFGDSVYFKSKVIADTLKNSRLVVAFIATIGEGLEAHVAGLVKAGQVADAAILDAIGSDMVEQAVNHWHKVLVNRSDDEGLIVSKRFCPGYCDWDITQQKELFKLLEMEADFVRVRLGESYMMTPRKSMAGIMGISRNGFCNPCRTCKNTDCQNRRQ